MSRSWLAGAFLFLLGFGCAKMATLPVATASATDGTVDGTLEYIDGKDEFELIYPPGGETDYLVIATRKGAPGTAPGHEISYDTGSTVISRDDLVSFTIYRLEPLVHSGNTLGSNIICDPGGPVICPAPPDPGPPPIFHDNRFLSSP